MRLSAEPARVARLNRIGNLREDVRQIIPLSKLFQTYDFFEKCVSRVKLLSGSARLL